MRSLMRARVLLLISLAVAGTTATTCTARSAIAVVPTASLGVDGTRDSVLAVVARLAHRYGAQEQKPDLQAEEHWIQCFSRETLMMCGKVYRGETQLRIYQARATRLTRWADSMNHELLDSLRRSFGVVQVRQCDWRLSGDAEGSGCRIPMAQ